MTTPLDQIPGSSMAAVRGYLLTRLAATVQPDPADTGASLLVCLDGPDTDVPEDVVSVGDVAITYDPFQTVGSGGPGWLTETYTVTVDIQVARGTPDSTVTVARALALANTVAAVVRADPSLGGLVDRARPADAHFETGWDDTGVGRITSVEMTIAILNAL